MPSQTERFQLRPATLADLDAILIACQNRAAFGTALLSVEDLRQRWHDSNFSLADQTQVVVSATKQLVGYGEIRVYGRNQFATELYLQPDLLTSEIGQQLLTTLEAKLAAGSHLIARVSGLNEQNQQIFAAAGYTQGLTFLMMEIEMDAVPTMPKEPEGIVVRPFQPNQDEQATYATDEAASLDKEYSKPLSFDAWAKRMSLHTERFDPSLWFLACHREDVVGVALNFFLPEQNCGLIDHLGVRRDWRGRGIGLALLQHSFAAFFVRGVPKVQLSVDSGSLTNAPRLYEKAGMKTVQTYHIYSKTVGPK